VVSDLLKERTENVATALANDSSGFTGHCPRSLDTHRILRLQILAANLSRLGPKECASELRTVSSVRGHNETPGPLSRAANLAWGGELRIARAIAERIATIR
jgi:hypothetical protein